MGFSLAADPVTEANSGIPPAINAEAPKYPEGQVLVVVPNSLASQWLSEASKLLESDKWIVMEYIRGELNATEFWTEVWPKALSKARENISGDGFNNESQNSQLEKRGPFIILIATHSVSSLPLRVFVTKRALGCSL